VATTANTKGGSVMAVINPLTKETAAASVQGIYDGFTKKFGFMPNIFAAMAHRPEALSTFLPFFQLMMEAGTLTDRDKQLAYLATSLLNGCEY
jgi:alkylhydroperoxidase family enzyme